MWTYKMSSQATSKLNDGTPKWFDSKNQCENIVVGYHTLLVNTFLSVSFPTTLLDHKTIQCL